MAKSPARRAFLKTLPVGLAGVAAGKVWAQNATPISADALRAAAQLGGLTLTDEEAAAAATGANANLSNLNRLRETKVPQDTEPAYLFRPSPPGHKTAGPATPGAPLAYSKAPAGLKAPADLEDVAFWPVAQLAALIQRRVVSSTELTRMYLARLKRLQPTLNFYVTLTEDLALQQAAEADRLIRAGRYLGPLHGLPWGAKDLFATKGIKTTWGAEPYVNQVFDYDATVVERLRAAGAVLVAKLTLGALAQGDRWFGGMTRNPWNPLAGSSGSSAGPASATAAGCVAFAIGSETRGSILSPSSVTGTVGLRPTYGRVSRYGAMALSPTMDKIGPLCRYVEDAAIVLNAIYGPDGRDGSVADAAFTWNPSAPLSRLRIAYVKSAFESVAAGERRTIAQSVLATYEKLGAKLEAVELPEGLIASAQALGFILSVEAAAAFDDLTRSGQLNQIATGTSASTWPNTFRNARLIPAVDYIRAMRARTLLMRQADAFFSKYDAVIEPSTGGTLATTNLTGHPAIALKSGFVQSPAYERGQPVVFMITGRLYEEATICRVALAYEQATAWKDRRPAI